MARCEDETCLVFRSLFRFQPHFPQCNPQCKTIRLNSRKKEKTAAQHRAFCFCLIEHLTAELFLGLKTVNDCKWCCKLEFDFEFFIPRTARVGEVRGRVGALKVTRTWTRGFKAKSYLSSELIMVIRWIYTSEEDIKHSQKEMEISKNNEKAFAAGKCSN